MIAMALHRPALALDAVLTHGVFALKLVAGVLAAGTVALAIMNNRDVKPAATGYEPASIETVVFRRTASSRRARKEPIAAADKSEAGLVLSARDPDHSLPQSHAARGVGLGNAGILARFDQGARLRDLRAEGRRGAGRQRSCGATASSGSAMDEIDDYLWEVYQRQPVKRDSTGDFTWKDPAAASRMGLSLQEYVIEGMDPGFREQLYRAGRAMDADGIQWSMLSAFRDDYRQRLASGFKARTGNSLHGGSRRTGGYGHGRAIDITTAEGDADVVWRWVDVHGSKYGLQRPMPGNDPAHIQQAGESRKGSTVATREARGRVAAAGGGRHKRKVRFARR